MNLPLEHVWQPARLPSQQLLILLHGRGDSAEGLLWAQETVAIDALNFLLLTAPNPYYDGFSWYDLPPNQLPGILESRKLLAQVLEETQRSGYPPEKTFLLGFSQGCLMTLEFGSRYSRRLAGYVGISGYCHDPGAILREMNPDVNHGDWLITHGTEDDLLPVETTRAQIKVLQDGGFKIDYREYRKSHTIDLGRELRDIREWISQRVAKESSS
jgi:phospholipase/carboxylesterase